MKTSSKSAASDTHHEHPAGNIEPPKAIIHPPVSFEKYLQWLTKVTAGVPPSREISGPETPFELYFPE
jgi:hypothetical protein